MTTPIDPLAAKVRWLAVAVAVAFAALVAPRTFAQEFEEITPQIEELGPADVGGAPPPVAPRTSQGVGSGSLDPTPPPPPPPVAQPIAQPPITIEPTNEMQTKTAVERQVAVPSRGISLDADFQDQIRSLNQQIADLKEKVIEAKSRLLSYSQKVAQGFASGTQLFMKVRNDLGKDFEIERLVFYLDGHQIFTRELEPGETFDELLAYKGSVLPGRHRIDVDAILRGDDGVFDFGYSARLRLESGEYFAANEGKIVELDLVLFDRGGAFRAIETRPGLKFEIVERDVF